MAWDEWEQLKSQAAMQLNQVPDEGGGAAPGGDLKVSQKDLAAVGGTVPSSFSRGWARTGVMPGPSVRPRPRI